ncbi:hypothetical protein N7539_005039 [Penicillium diatomitis]|uniref:Uncharacterized protein n=1 Tax=Penicillium diatomitis TaxID=2819901 RepID=A0A9W9X6I7_9EURO|nr:uncharacterized protein N7539_005039 [Penicillium diatomitis]KAJ5485051.1 hypothetical protein N7539_005039 [Penicillium diatomitis]
MCQSILTLRVSIACSHAGQEFEDTGNQKPVYANTREGKSRREVGNAKAEKVKPRGSIEG